MMDVPLPFHWSMYTISISKFDLTVCKKIYNKRLRLSKSVSCGNVGSLCTSYCQVLDYGLLATLSSLSGKEILN